MKRQKIEQQAQPGYPSRDTFRPSRRPALLLFGMLVAVVGAPGCEEIFTETDIGGDMTVPQETWNVVMPEAGSRTLYFLESGGWLDYHVELVVDNHDLAAFLAEDAQNLLDRVDSALGTYDPEVFEDLDALREVEQIIQQLFADAWTGSAEAPTWNFVDCALVVDELVPYEEVDGDMG
jgi:hypothetical protein